MNFKYETNNDIEEEIKNLIEAADNAFIDGDYIHYTILQERARQLRRKLREKKFNIGKISYD